MQNDENLAKVQHALRIAEDHGDDARKADLRENVGDVYLKADNTEQALVYFQKIRNSAKWHSFRTTDKARIWHKMALAHDGRGDLEPALRLAMQAERALDREGDSPLLGKIYSLAGRLNRKLGNHRDALAYSLRALYLLRNSPENREIADVQLTTGSIFLRQGNFDEAVRYFQDSLSTSRRIDDEQGKARANNNLGVAYKNLCQWDNATRSLNRAIKIDHHFGNYLGVALRSLNLGIIHYHLGEWSAASAKIEKSVQMSRAVGDSLGVTRCSLALARMARNGRRWTEAKNYATEALRLSSRHRNRRETAASFEELGAWYFDRGQFETARTFFHKSLGIARDISDRNDHIAEVNRRLSELESIWGNPVAGEKHARDALHMAIRIRDKRLVGLALRALALACRRGGEIKKGARYAGRSVRILESIGIPFELGRSLIEKSIASGMLDDFGTARSDLTRAEAIFRRFSADTYSCRVLIEFARLKIRSDRVEDGLVLLHKAEKLIDRERNTDEAREIARLRSSIEERFVEYSQGSNNRFLLLNGGSAGGLRTIDSVLEPLGADRGFLFVRKGDREWQVGECRNIDQEEAAAILERTKKRWNTNGKTSPVVSFGRNVTNSIPSYMVVPGSGGSAPGIYVDRMLSGGRVNFTRRDLNFLVGAVGSLQLPGMGTADDSRDRFGGVISRNKKMLDILAMLRKLSGMHITILIQGETGTGKGLLAYEISKGYPGPFVTINCADISETILESELFGHVKSAFTGAHCAKKGLFEVADGGTVFIDEIDKTSRNFQEKLLRVVDRQEFKPVGSVNVKKVECRIVCASNKDLRREVEKKTFLQDLYYRLKVISIHLPPLRERREDIPILTEHFRGSFLEQLKKNGIAFSLEVIDLFSRYSWPGNIRDLENEIERAVALASPGVQVEVDDLSDELVTFASGGIAVPQAGEKPLARVVEEVEEKMIRNALEKCGGNKSQAARMLGITRKGLRNKIQRYNIDM